MLGFIQEGAVLPLEMARRSRPHPHQPCIVIGYYFHVTDFYTHFGLLQEWFMSHVHQNSGNIFYIIMASSEILCLYSAFLNDVNPLQILMKFYNEDSGQVAG